MVLNLCQQNALDLILQEHNAFITGEAGTGKSYLLGRVFDDVSQQGKKVSVTCTTGIACKNLPSHLRPVTLHSFAGIKEGRGSAEFLLRRVEANDDALMRWKTTDLLVIDEVSMLSARLFECIEFIARKVRSSDKLFGALQVVVLGDFYQLPPVPGYDDDGRYCFESLIWEKIFPHNCLLDIVVRQKEPDFISFVNEMRKGKCGPSSIAYSHGLARRVRPEDFGASWLTQIYPTNDEVDFANFEYLESIEGDLHTWRAKDNGDKKVLNRNLLLREVLQLKEDARVMLITNLSQTLVNGSTGIVSGFTAQRFPVVSFDDGTTLTIEPVTLTVTNPADPSQIVASRTQLPLKLAWAITAHKSQGMTLPCVEVHCGKEFVSGQLYVSLSRVKESAGLSLVGFRKANLIPPPKVVVDFYAKIESEKEEKQQMCSSKQCCNQSDYTEPKTNCEEDSHCDGGVEWELCDIEDYDIAEEDLLEIDSVISGFFDNISNQEESLPLIDLDHLLEDLDCTDDLAQPGVDFDCNCFLSSIKLPSNDRRPLVKEINDVIDSLVCPERFQAFDKFFRIQWNRVYVKIKDCVIANTNQKIERKNFTAHFGELHQLCISDDSLEEFASVLGKTRGHLSRPHFCVLTEVLSAINTILINTICQQNVPDCVPSVVFASVKNMPAESKGKVRHCMGWAISREREKLRQEFKRHLNSENKSLRALTKQDFKKKELIDSLTCSSQDVHEVSKFPESLTVTDARQFRNKGLTFIRDDVYLFALDVEDTRMSLLNMRMLKGLKDEVLEHGKKELCASANLKMKWRGLFPSDSNLGIVDKLFEDVISRYMNMAGAQFLRDFRREINLKKTEAHRKKILAKSKTQELKGAKVTVESVLQDQCDRREKSHILLQAMLVKQPSILKTRVYTKEELKTLLTLYGVLHNSSQDKEKLADMLSKTIREQSGFTQPGSSRSFQDGAANSIQAEPLSPPVRDSETLGTSTVTVTERTMEHTLPTRKRFRPSVQELNMLKADHQLQDYRSTVAERARQFGVSEKQILNWHKRFKPD